MKMGSKNIEEGYTLNDLLTSIKVIRNHTDNKDVLSRLDKCYDEIKYAKPSKKEKVMLINRQIENKFDDVRLKIVHNDLEGAFSELDEVDSLLIKRKGATDSLKEENKVSLFRKIFPKKKTLAKLQKSEVVDQIIELERRQEELVKKIEGSDEAAKEMFNKGKNEKNLQMRTFYAKKVESINREKASNIKRATMLNFQLTQLNRLMNAIDDRDFFYDPHNENVMTLLQDEKQLKAFLAKNRVMEEAAEDKLLNVESAFDDYDAMASDNEAIYGSKQSTDDILAQMEMQAQMEDEEALYNGTYTSAKKENKEEV